MPAGEVSAGAQVSMPAIFGGCACWCSWNTCERVIDEGAGKGRGAVAGASEGASGVT